MERPKNSKQTKYLRQQLRNNSTVAEKSLWLMLKGRQIAGLKFRRQFNIDNYILDFYCPELKLCIELDGDYHYHVMQPVLDYERDTILMEKYGIKTLRFENKMVFNRSFIIRDAILNYRDQVLNTLRNHTPPALRATSPILGEEPLQNPAYDNNNADKDGNASSPPKIGGVGEARGGMNENKMTVASRDINESGVTEGHTPPALRATSPILGEESS